MTMTDFAFLLLKIAFSIIFVCFVYHILTRKYLNPYTLTFIFAKKGQGKSTLLTKLALQHLARGWTVYSTDRIPGCYYVPVEVVGYVEFKPHSLLIIDEIGMIWDNRSFKSFPAAVRDWFKLQRHRQVKVVCASQSFDVDKKIRDLADDMYLLNKRFRVFSYGKRILKVLDIVEATGDSNSESRIVDQLRFDTILLFWAGSRTLTYIPHWVPYFDSFAAPELQRKDFELCPLPDKLPRSLRGKRRAADRRRRLRWLPHPLSRPCGSLLRELRDRASTIIGRRWH